MCGRFVSASPPDELARYFRAQPPERQLEASFNVAPTDEVYVVRSASGHRQLATLRWGLVPFWAKEARVGARMINARAESLFDKPAFRNAVRNRRCLIPADGFYEWAKVAGHKAKQPYYIYRRDGEPLAFAGLWERWRRPDTEGAPQVLETCAVVTCGANAPMASIHDRMPCLLPPSSWDRWLEGGADGVQPADEPEAGLGDLARLLVPAPDDLLTIRPVTTAVNRVANKGPELVLEETNPLVPEP
jgi:putative SOS response-associated peptidase YedK